MSRIHLRHPSEPRSRCNNPMGLYDPMPMTTNPAKATCQRCLNSLKSEAKRSELTCSECGVKGSPRYYGLTKGPLLCRNCYQNVGPKTKVYQFAGEV